MILTPSGFPSRPWAVRLGWSILALGLVVLTGACQQSERSVESYLEGRVVVDSSLASSNGHGNFRLLALHPNGRQLDTLGHARTDQEGRFRMTIAAPERGVYPLTLWGRQGREELASTNYVVAPGDSGSLHVQLPLNGRPLRPESPENLALLGYQNAMAMHRRMFSRRLQSDAPRSNSILQDIRLTSSILWNLRNNYPGTYAGELGAVQSLSLLEDWNDSLVVARAQQIDPSSPYYVDAARIARRAEARRHGHGAALNLVDTFQARTSQPRTQAGVKAVRVEAFLDSTQFEAAFSAAQQLKAEHPNTTWAQWARNVRQNAKHLMPGMTAPNLRVQTLGGDTLSLHDLRGHPVVLEYYRPGADLYNLQRPLRDALYEVTRPDSVAFVSISIEPDSLVNRVFLHNQDLPGHKAISPRGSKDPLVTRYNVVHVPSWVLIDEAGKIVDQYQASALPTLQQHLTQLLLPPSLGSSPR